MKSLPPPITPETFEKIVRQWLKVINYKESASIYFYARPGVLRRINQLLKEKKVLKKYLEAPQKTKLVVLNLDLLPIEDPEGLEEFLLKEKVGDLSRDHQVAFFVVPADKILKEKREDLLAALEELEVKNDQFSFLLFFNIDFTHPQFLPLLTSKSVFLQNIITHPLYQEKDVRQFIFYLSNKWQVEVDKKLREEIVENCGGNFWFVKQAIRFLRGNPTASKEEVFSHEEMKLKLEMIWDNFLESEKRVIEKIVSKRKDFLGDENHSLRFLKKINLVGKDKKFPRLKIPLLEEFVKEKIRREKIRNELKLKDTFIYLKGVLVEKNFSKKERKLLKLLLKRQGRFVSRDEIAASLWGGDFEEKYSDWAIDQLICRLRRKLKILGLSPELIKTIRGRGFVLPAKA